MSYTRLSIWEAFKSLAASRGYTRKVSGSFMMEQPLKGRIGHSLRLFGTKEDGFYMEVYDTKVGERELIPIGDWKEREED